MAASTTVFNGCDSVVRLDNSGGTLVDISGSSNNIEFDPKREIGEFKPFSTPWKTRIDCGKDAAIKLSIVCSTAAGEGMDILLDWFFNGSGLRTLQWDFPNSNSGSRRFQAEVVLSDFNMAAGSDEADPMMLEANLMPSGAVTYSTI